MNRIMRIGILAVLVAGPVAAWVAALAGTRVHQTSVVWTRFSDPPGLVVGEANVDIDAATGFAVAAFPPTLTDRAWHADAWDTNACLRCHETGVGDAPMIQHRGLPAIAAEAKCRSCHVPEPGKVDRVTPLTDHGPFLADAFPPMIPNDGFHQDAWAVDCLMCHERGILDAPVVQHRNLPPILMEAKCRTCHVQVRSHEALKTR